MRNYEEDYHDKCPYFKEAKCMKYEMEEDPYDEYVYKVYEVWSCGYCYSEYHDRTPGFQDHDYCGECRCDKPIKNELMNMKSEVTL